MKRLTNPIFLQTTHFQLSDDQSELLKLEMAEVRESAAKTGNTVNCRINAIHAGTTKNYHTFPLEELEKSVEKWTKPYGKPILKNHDITEEPLGRIREASVLRFSDNDGVLSVVASIADQDTIQKIYDQRYMTVSIGVASHNVTCSICGVNWFEDECDHHPGRKYYNEDGTEELQCTAVIRDLSPMELSFVNVPADANDTRFAGIVTVGESDEFEFYSESGEGVTTKGVKKKSKEGKTSDDLALALKEAYEDFLSLFKTEGEDSQTMDEETKPLESSSVEDANLDATNTGDESGDNSTASVEEETATQEENAQESTEEVVEDNQDSTSIDEGNDDIAVLDEYLSEEEATASEAEETTGESEDEPVDFEAQVTELQNRIQELEADNAVLKNDLKAQEDEASKWVKRTRSFLSQHVVDLKIFLNKASGKDFETLEAEEKLHGLKDLVDELEELRKEFKESDLNIDDVFTQQGLLARASIAPEQPADKIGDSTQSEHVDETLSEDEVVTSFSKQWSQSRPYKKERS